jgi:hypothetical protein
MAKKSDPWSRIAGATKKVVVSRKTGDSPSLRNPQVEKRRIVGPDWVAARVRQRHFAVPVWRVRTYALGRRP